MLEDLWRRSQCDDHKAFVLAKVLGNESYERGLACLKQHLGEVVEVGSGRVRERVH